MAAIDYDFNKVNKRLLETISELCGLSDHIQNFIESGTQKDLDIIAKDIDKIDLQINDTKEKIMSVIKNIVGMEEEIKGVETDNGIEL